MTVVSHPAVGRLVVGPVPAPRLYPLRQQVLRPHQRVEDVGLPGDSHPDCGAIAAVTDDGEVVAIATVAPEEPPERLAAVVAAGPVWRLRSMATRPDLRGSGLGAAVLDAAVEHVARRGGGVVWCSARTPAAGFYERAGFRAFGDPWVEEHIGPHILMWRKVAPAATAGQPPAGFA